MDCGSDNGLESGECLIQDQEEEKWIRFGNKTGPRLHNVTLARCSESVDVCSLQSVDDLLESLPRQPVRPAPLPRWSVVTGVETEDGVVENVGTARQGHVVEDGSQTPPDGVAAVEPDNLYFIFSWEPAL